MHDRLYQTLSRNLGKLHQFENLRQDFLQSLVWLIIVVSHKIGIGGSHVVHYIVYYVYQGMKNMGIYNMFKKLTTDTS